MRWYFYWGRSLNMTWPESWNWKGSFPYLIGHPQKLQNCYFRKEGVSQVLSIRICPYPHLLRMSLKKIPEVSLLVLLLGKTPKCISLDVCSHQRHHMIPDLYFPLPSIPLYGQLSSKTLTALPTLAFVKTPHLLTSPSMKTCPTVILRVVNPYQ